MSDSISHRASPSAGGLHPIEIVVQGLSDHAGLFHYDPESHRLIELEYGQFAQEKLFAEAEACLPCSAATIFWMLAVPQRTEMKYSNADTLILRDAGALIATLVLCATALQLFSAPLGTRGEPMLSNLTTWSLPVVGVGGVHVSSP
ncbi:hypothetical protein [Paraburkholderia sp. D1E]|uniref:hypothetical protein n=1 Tax=Paraburkholderia sp. D1E TaxID=3461398 RepID=UPI004046194D